jgi:integrase
MLYCWYNDVGEERSKVLGNAGMTDADGWLKVADLKLNVNVGKPDPNNAKHGDVLAAWLSYGKTKTGEAKDHTTMATDRHNAETYLCHWSERIAKDIQPLEIQNWLDSQSRGIRSKLRNTMSAVYSYGQKFGFIPRGAENNPMFHVSAPATSDYEAISLSGAEAASVIKQMNDPSLKALVILIAVTGMRISEAIALTWNVVDWMKGKIRITRKFAYGEYGKPKSKMSGKPIEMTESLAAVLQLWRSETSYAKDADLIFPSEKLFGKVPRTKSMAAKVLRKAAIAAGVLESKDDEIYYDGEIVHRFGFHNLRHGIATWLAESGTDPIVIARMLRHADTSMSMKYVHATKQARRAQEQYITELGIHSGCRLRVQ